MHEMILKNISRFILLTPEEVRYFTSLLRIKKIKKRQYLLQEGDIARHEYFVNKGCLRAYYTDEKGIEHIGQFAIEDWWIGDMYSFLTSSPSRINIDALEDSEVITIDKESIENLYLEVPKFERFFRIIIQNAFIATSRRVIESISLPAEERYSRFIERYPDMEKRLPLKQIASYLGITPESLSRIRNQYFKSGKS